MPTLVSRMQLLLLHALLIFLSNRIATDSYESLSIVQTVELFQREEYIE
jgi:hypothetical protein